MKFKSAEERAEESEEEQVNAAQLEEIKEVEVREVEVPAAVEAGISIRDEDQLTIAEIKICKQYCNNRIYVRTEN